MAIERDINKKKKEREPAQKASPMKPFGKKGLKSPTYGRRNPHKDHGDKKPSLKTKSSIIKDKAKKGQGLNRGGVARTKKRVTERQKELMDMLNRLYGNKKTMERPIMPKDKPKKKPIRPILPKPFKKPKMKRTK